MLRLSIATRRSIFVLRIAGPARVVISDDPTVPVRLATAVSQFDGQTAAFDKAPNDLLNASFGHTTFGGEVGDAGPGIALAFVDEVGEDIGEHEGKRRQLGIGAHLVEPEKFFARKGDTTICLRIGDARKIAAVSGTRIETRRATLQI